MSARAVFLARFVTGQTLWLTRSGGKAGRGQNKTASLRLDSGHACRYFRFVNGDEASRKAALAKVAQYVRAQAERNQP